MGKRANLIGGDNEPVRAVTFAGGGFGTALQLGVAHALLVSRGEAPDVVVGISAGAVNAVALAEVLQAGEKKKDNPEQRLRLRIERFRTIFESYQSAPTELASALLPDSLQIDTQRPLKPLELPIHAEIERQERDRALHSRSGLVNVYNELLGLRLPIGTIARAVRRFLGLKAIGEERDLVRLLPTAIEESLPFLDMIGANLHRLAPLLPVVLPAAVLRDRKPPEAASAGELIFQAKALELLKRTALYALSFGVLVVVWLAFTLATFGLLAVAVALIILSVVWRMAAKKVRKWGPGKRLQQGWAGLRSRYAALRSKLVALRRAAGFPESRKAVSSAGRRLGNRIRSARERVAELRATRWLLVMLRKVGRALSFARLLRRLQNTRLLRPASEALTSYLKQLTERRERREAKKKARKKRKKTTLFFARRAAPAAAPEEEEVGVDPVRATPTRAVVEAGMRTWLRLVLTLLWRWLLWAIPVAVLLALAPPIVGPVLLVLLALGVCAVGLLISRRASLRLNFLRRNSLSRSLFDSHPLRQFLVRLFDPDYYGELDIDGVVERAMANSPTAPRKRPRRSRMRRYARADPPIRVEVAAANVETGEMETLPEATPVVDALMAGMAMVPFFPAKRVGRTYYVDGTNIANEPTRPLLKFLRERLPEDPKRPRPGEINPRSPMIHMYTVSPLPISRPELGVRRKRTNGASRAQDGTVASGAHWPLVDVVERALELQRFRDARLERQLTELYTRTMPAGGEAVFRARPAFRGDAGKKYMRTWVYPIEPQEPVAVNRRVLRARSENDRRRLVAETVADGCRAALEAMIQPDIRKSGTSEVRCSKAVASRLAGNGNGGLPGSDPNRGPGLAEVCRHCALTRAEDGFAKPRKRCRLVVKSEEQSPPPWPLEGRRSTGLNDKRLEPPSNQQKVEAYKVLREYRKNEYKTADLKESTPWPREPDRPTVSLLFSGGVFRGVFQLGVLNALSEVGLCPDIVAGASVGSITAAMAARVFAESDRAERCERIRRLAATYMAIDRLVLTDRFSDFVRTMTVRAAQTRFSLRQADQVVRQYDRVMSGRYGRQARTVLAGLERLLYISPFEFRDLIEALRLRRSDKAFALIREFFQELLDRGGVGEEVLGSEPLELLIVEHVLDKAGLTEAELKSTPFEHFLANGMYFLATATNLTRGRLEILGEHQLGTRKQRTSLIQGLLASSAFPGVFRPRWSWEVMPHAASQDLFADGGVMDNLPLDAVARFLVVAAQARLIQARPTTPAGPVPHLLFSASLQEDPPRLGPAEVERLAGDWSALFARTKHLSYNQKLDIFDRAQQAVRRIWATSERPAPENFVPIDLETVTVRPRWLCGTFAFHPMLGFRRLQQARSIAHGCASTLIRLDRYRGIRTRKRWMGPGNWGVDLDRLPAVVRLNRPSPFQPVTPPKRAAKGYCWFRPDHRCPFSSYSQKEFRRDTGRKETEPHTAFELNRIHEQCGLAETHAPGA